MLAPFCLFVWVFENVKVLVEKMKSIRAWSPMIPFEINDLTNLHSRKNVIETDDGDDLIDKLGNQFCT